jgi:hypothetical protein
MTAFCANTNILDIVGLRAENDNDAPINDAVCELTIRDSNGVELAGAVWPLAMSYLPASAGDYRAYLPADLPFEPKKNYIAYIDAFGGAFRVGHWELHFKPLARAVTEAAV